MLTVYSKWVNIESPPCRNCSQFDTALLLVFSNKRAKCEADQTCGSLDTTDRQVAIPFRVVNMARILV